MAVLIDLNQTLIAGIMVQIGSKGSVKLDESLIRHIALNILRGHVKRFKEKYGEIILCADSRRYWRKECFPFYKAHRSKAKAKSNIDWEIIYKVMNSLKADMAEYFPYKMIEVDGAEADDIIGVLSPYIRNDVMIVSTDSDFLQLQKYKGVQQYNPITGKMMKSADPMKDLKAKLIRGDKGDGIPNFLSGSDFFVLGLRQKPISEKKFAEFMSMEINEHTVTADQYARWMRNKTLIDFGYIPKDISNNILEAYNTPQKPFSRMKMFNYFIENNLKELMNVIEDF